MISLSVGHQANGPAVKMILPTLFEHLEERFSYEEVRFKKLSSTCENKLPSYWKYCYVKKNLGL